MATYKKGLVLSLGPISTSVDLTSVIPTSKEGGLKRICPEHQMPLKQRYYCEPGDHNIEWGEWLSAGIVDGDMYAVEPDSKPEKTSVDSLELTPVPTEQIEEVTLEGSSMFYLKPSSEAYNLTWTMFYRAAQKNKASLVARGILRKNTNERLFKLTTFNGYLVLREIYFPEKIVKPPAEPAAVTVDRDTQKLFNQLMENVTTDWSKLDVNSTKEIETQEWLKTGIKVEVHESADLPIKTPAQQVNELQAALEKAVNNAGK